MNIRFLVIAVIICLTISGTSQKDKVNPQDHASSEANKDEINPQENNAPSNHKLTPIVLSTTQNQPPTPSIPISKELKTNEIASKDKNKTVKNILKNDGEKKNETQKLEKKDNTEKPQQKQGQAINKKNNSTNGSKIKLKQLSDKKIQKVKQKQDIGDSNHEKQNIQPNNQEKDLIKVNDKIKDPVNGFKSSPQDTEKGVNIVERIQNNKEKQSIQKNIKQSPAIEIKQKQIQTQILPTVEKQQNGNEKQIKIEKTQIDGITTIHPINQIQQKQANAQQKDILKEDNNLITSNQEKIDNLQQKEQKDAQKMIKKTKVSETIKPQTNNALQDINFQSEIKIIKIQNQEPNSGIEQDSSSKQNEEKINVISESTKKGQTNLTVIESPQDVKEEQDKKNAKEETSSLKNDNFEYGKQIDHRQDEIKIIPIEKEETPAQSNSQSIANQQTNNSKITLNKLVQTGDSKNQLNQPIKTQNMNATSTEESVNNKKGQDILSPADSYAVNGQESTKQHVHYYEYKSEQSLFNQKIDETKPPTDLSNEQEKITQKQIITQTKILSDADISHIYFPVRQEQEQFQTSYATLESGETSKSQGSVSMKKQEKSTNLQLRTADERPPQKQQLLNTLVEQDPQLPKDQIMDTQTIIVLIILTFIISIPVVRQIRSRGGQKQRSTDDPILKTQKLQTQANSGQQYSQVDNGTGLQIQA